MKHPDEEQLVAHYYGDAPDEAAWTAVHLMDCQDCATAYAGLRRVLETVSAAPMPEPGLGYEAAVWRRLRPRLALRERAWMWPHWVGAAAVAAMLLMAFFAGRRSADPESPVAAAPAPEVRERILMVALGDHLERSQMVLIELANAKSGRSADISNEREWAEDLLGDNRLYRQAALSAGETGVAMVLDDLERLLLELAHSPSRIPGRELEQIRARMEAQGILFKVRAIGARLRQAAAPGSEL